MNPPAPQTSILCFFIKIVPASFSSFVLSAISGTLQIKARPILLNRCRNDSIAKGAQMNAIQSEFARRNSTFELRDIEQWNPSFVRPGYKRLRGRLLRSVGQSVAECNKQDGLAPVSNGDKRMESILAGINCYSDFQFHSGWLSAANDHHW
jgi:hypothetical protein